jgi:predicted amidohydrolase
VSSLRIAGAQLAVTDDIESNGAAIRRALAFAAENGADLLLTPEGSLSGYTPRFDAAALVDALAAITSGAREAGIALALGTCFFEQDGRCYNQIRFYERDGSYLGFHAKILRCGSLTDPPHGEIQEYAEAPLRTFDLAGTRVGGLICNDLWANPMCTPQPDPHLTQRLAAMGARLILHAVNGGRDGGPFWRTNWDYHETNLRMRAAAGRLWIATVDSAEPEHLNCSAPSGLVNPRGEWAVQAPMRGEQLFLGDIDLERSDEELPLAAAAAV